MPKQDMLTKRRRKKKVQKEEKKELLNWSTRARWMLFGGGKWLNWYTKWITKYNQPTNEKKKRPNNEGEIGAVEEDNEE